MTTTEIIAAVTDNTDIATTDKDLSAAVTTSTTKATKEALDAVLGDSREQAEKYLSHEAQSEAARRKALADLAFILVKAGPNSQYVSDILTEDGLQQKYKARESAAMVRVVFGYKLSKEKTEKARKENQRISNTVNRYANVVDACVENFTSLGVVTVDLIEAFIGEHGIDALAKSKGKQVEEVVPSVESTLATINPMGTFALPERLKNRTTPFTLVVVPSGDRGNIVLVQSGDEDLLRKVVNHAQGHDLTNVAPAVNLMSEVAVLSSFISEPDSDQPTLEGADRQLNTTKFLPATRMTMFRKDADGWSISVSNMRLHSGPVVHVKPLCQFEIPADDDVMLDTKGRRWFEVEVAPESRRGHYTFKAEKVEDDENRVAEFVFTRSADQKVRKVKLVAPHSKADPIDVQLTGLSWDFEFPISVGDLAKLRSQYFAQWAKLHKSKTRAATLDMTFSAAGWKLDHHDSQPITFGVATGIAGTKTFRMKGLGQHWNGLFRQLEQLGLVGRIEIAGVQSGMWRVSFQTELAVYTVYLPTALDAKGETLNPKYFSTYSSLRK